MNVARFRRLVDKVLQGHGHFRSSQACETVGGEFSSGSVTTEFPPTRILTVPSANLPYARHNSPAWRWRTRSMAARTLAGRLLFAHPADLSLRARKKSKVIGIR